MKTALFAALCGLALLPGLAQAGSLSASFTDPAWGGTMLPKGQNCSKFGGHGATPPLKIDGIPAGADAIVIQFNDADYQPLSSNGGHGTIGYRIAPGAGTAMLPAVPGETDGGLPDGTWVVKRNRASGSFAAPGYLPPCSGGRGHYYNAKIMAVKMDSGGTYDVLDDIRIDIGKY